MIYFIIIIILTVFPVSVIAQNNIKDQYINILNKKIINCKPELEKSKSENLRPFSNVFENKKNFYKYKEIEKDIFLSCLVKSGSKISKDTEIYKNLKKIKDRYFKYFTIEYSKGISGNTTFIFPGNNLSIEDEKQYKISLSSFISDNINIKTTLNILIFKTNLNISYMFLDKEYIAVVSNNSYFKISANKKEDGEIIYMAIVKLKF